MKVSEADTIKLLRNGEPLPVESVSKLGDKPIRKKAFWRAFRRKELWAICSYQQLQVNRALKEMTNKINADIYCPNDQVYFIWPLTKILSDDKI